MGHYGTIQWKWRFIAWKIVFQNILKSSINGLCSIVTLWYWLTVCYGTWPIYRWFIPSKIVMFHSYLKLPVWFCLAWYYYVMHCVGNIIQCIVRKNGSFGKVWEGVVLWNIWEYLREIYLFDTFTDTETHITREYICLLIMIG